MSSRLRDIGWIGVGRMGFPMVERLLAAGHKPRIFNRTRAKAEPLAAKGAIIVDSPAALADAGILFIIVGTGKDLEEVCFGQHGVIGGAGAKAPGVIVDLSSIGAEESGAIRVRLAEHDVPFLCSPVSGNGNCVRAGKLSTVASGPEAAFALAKPYLEIIAGAGASYVGEGERARICKIAHNVLLGVVVQTLAEIVLLAEKSGIPRHAFMEFVNNSVLGSVFTRYKTPAIVNLDWTTTFTPTLLRKDLDLGLDLGHTLGVPMPVTATVREALQAHFGAATMKPDPAAYLAQDFMALLETAALAAGVKLASENQKVRSGLEVATPA